MSIEWKRGALVAVLAVGSSCAAPSRAPAPAPAPTPTPMPPAGTSASTPENGTSRVAPVVLITIDGARWQEIFHGSDTSLSHAPLRSSGELVPNLDRLARERGAAIGAPGRGLIRATGPNFVSLPGYTEILTGRAPIGCQDNTCPTIAVPTFLDDARATGAKVAAFGSWEMLDRAVSARPGTFPVSCGRSASDQADVDPWPGSGNFRPDRFTAEAALRHLATDQPDVLYVGLGEPDEYGHRDDYAGYLTALTYADAFVGRVMDTLDHMGPRGSRTHVVVTADHGRARDFKGHGGGAPESARVWLIAAGPSITARGRVVSSRERHLADVAPTLRHLAGLAPARTLDRDHDHGWPGEPLAELLQPGTSPIAQATPVPPSPQ
jgi:hypothetical protein